MYLLRDDGDYYFAMPIDEGMRIPKGNRYSVVDDLDDSSISKPVVTDFEDDGSGEQKPVEVDREALKEQRKQEKESAEVEVAAKGEKQYKAAMQMLLVSRAVHSKSVSFLDLSTTLLKVFDADESLDAKQLFNAVIKEL